MLPKLAQTVRRENLFRPGERVLIAVSGGADSTALLYGLHFFSERLKLELCLLHVGHGLRGREAREEARFVRLLAAKLNLPYYERSVPVRTHAREQGCSIETAARELRQQVYGEVLRESGAESLALGHTLDDQAETLLLHLVRGSGPRGLCGMGYADVTRGLPIRRPLLDHYHQELCDFLLRHGLPWREDSSNGSAEHYRNRVRHEILPQLKEQLNPETPRHLHRLAGILREEEAWLEPIVARHLAELQRAGGGEGGAPGLDVPGLQALPSAARRRVLRHWLAGEGEPGPNWEITEQLMHLCAEVNGSAWVDLPGKRGRVIRRYEVLQREAARGESTWGYALALPLIGSSCIPGMDLVVTTRQAEGYRKPVAGEHPGNFPLFGWISAARALPAAGLILRPWRSGDRIRPVGMKGSRKVQDVFSDLKVPRDVRQRLPLLVSGEEVVWIPGYRISRDWALSSAKEASLEIELAYASSSASLRNS